MKRVLVLLLLLLVAAGLFADDALVLPRGVMRTYITGAYAFFNKVYNIDAEKVDPSGYDSLNAVNLGGAVEFGVIDWISAAIQWAPGWTVWSATKNGAVVAPGLDYANLTVNGPYDVFAGAKIQIVGSKAPVASQKIRLAVAPGVKIPVMQPDAAYWSDQFTAATTGDTWLGAYNDKPLWGLGARAYFDYVLNKMFYINLYSEFIYYLGTAKRETLGAEDWIQVNLAAQPNSDVSLGYDLTLELEPHFEMMFGEGLRLGAGLPVTFTQSPELKFDDVAQADTDSYLLAVGPNVSLFLLKSFIPVEFKLGYTLPLLGKNNFATNTLVLQVKLYMRFYK
jgi:hypothetical protein